MNTIQGLCEDLQKNSLVSNEWLNRFADENGECEAPVSGCTTEGEIIIMLQSQEQELTQLKAEKTGEWVSVADRLPTFLQYEDGEPVEYLVMLKYANVPTTLYFDGKQWFDFDWNCWKRVDNEYEVTHWQPLPQPPKDGD